MRGPVPSLSPSLWPWWLLRNGAERRPRGSPGPQSEEQERRRGGRQPSLWAWKVLDFIFPFFLPIDSAHRLHFFFFPGEEGEREERSRENKQGFPPRRQRQLRKPFREAPAAAFAGAAGAGPPAHHARAGLGLLSAGTREPRPQRGPPALRAGPVRGRRRRDGARDRTPGRHGAGADPRGGAGHQAVS